jgi:hypothetical protein
MNVTKSFLFLLLITLIISCDKAATEPSSDIENGDFSNGTQNWKLKTDGDGEGSIEVADGAMKISITSVPENDWEVRLTYTKGLLLENNTRYRLGFEAWTPGEDKQIRADFNGWENNNFEHFSDFTPAFANTHKTEFFKSFVMNSEADDYTDLDFFIGADEQDVYFDNITLEKKPAPEADLTDHWTIVSYDGSGNKGARYAVDFEMSSDGTLKRKTDNYFFSGYVAGNEVEAMLYSNLYFKGTIDETNDTIRGDFFNYEEGFAGSFMGVRGVLHEDVSGTYTLYANYTTPYVRVNNETDYITIIQNENVLEIAGKPGSTGTINGVEVTLEGDILPGEASGASQTFTGSVSGNSISGSISGFVMQKDASGTEIFLQAIASGDFTMIKVEG